MPVVPVFGRLALGGTGCDSRGGDRSGPAVLDLLGADLMLVEGLLLRSVSSRVYLAPLLSPACVHSAAGVLRLPRTGTQP